MDGKKLQVGTIFDAKNIIPDFQRKFSWSYEETKSTLNTFVDLFNPFSNMDELDAQPRLRNMSGPESTINSINRRLAGIGLNRVLILFAFLNLFFWVKVPVDLYRISSSRSGILF